MNQEFFINLPSMRYTPAKNKSCFYCFLYCLVCYAEPIKVRADNTPGYLQQLPLLWGNGESDLSQSPYLVSKDSTELPLEDVVVCNVFVIFKNYMEILFPFLTLNYSELFMVF